MLKVMPNHNRILVQQLNTKQSETASGIALPSTLDREEKTQGKILQVGKEFKGKYEIGQTVFYGKYAGETIKLKQGDKFKEEEFVLLTDEDILGWIL